MKKSILFLTLFFFMTILFAQTWAPVGAKWYYSQVTNNPNVHSYKTIESIGDTVLQNKACKKMLEIERVINPISQKIYFMYSLNDSVFYYDEIASKFCLLYLFNAQQGDTINLDCFNFKVTVDSTDTISIFGQLRKVQYISSNSLGYNFWGRNIEGIGNAVFMFPQGDMYMNGPLRCYEDSIGLMEFSILPCDTILNTTSLNEYLIPINFDLFPNPANSMIFIEFNDVHEFNYSIEIYSIIGKRQLSITGIKNNYSIDIDKLSKGLYFVRIINEDGLSCEKKFIKQ